MSTLSLFRRIRKQSDASARASHEIGEGEGGFPFPFFFRIADLSTQIRSPFLSRIADLSAQIRSPFLLLLDLLNHNESLPAAQSHLPKACYAQNALPPLFPRDLYHHAHQKRTLTVIHPRLGSFFSPFSTLMCRLHSFEATYSRLQSTVLCRRNPRAFHSLGSQNEPT